MVEISTADLKEVRNKENDNYKEIKPQSDINSKSAKEFWDDKFNNVKESRSRFDDNGEKYRENNELIPNNTYEVNGYTYKTDGEGRIVSAEGKLQVRNHEGRFDMPDKMSAVGKGDQKGTDNRGHLIADRFNGSGELANLVPMDSKLNGGDYSKLEGTLGEAVNDGADVRLKVEPVYNDNTFRPSEFRISYTIDGDKDVVVFKNGGSN